MPTKPTLTRFCSPPSLGVCGSQSAGPTIPESPPALSLLALCPFPESFDGPSDFAEDRPPENMKPYNPTVVIMAGSTQGPLLPRKTEPTECWGTLRGGCVFHRLPNLLCWPVTLWISRSLRSSRDPRPSLLSLGRPGWPPASPQATGDSESHQDSEQSAQNTQWVRRGGPRAVRPRQNWPNALWDPPEGMCLRDGRPLLLEGSAAEAPGGPHCSPGSAGQQTRDPPLGLDPREAPRGLGESWLRGQGLVQLEACPPLPCALTASAPRNRPRLGAGDTRESDPEISGYTGLGFRTGREGSWGSWSGGRVQQWGGGQQRGTGVTQRSARGRGGVGSRRGRGGRAAGRRAARGGGAVAGQRGSGGAGGGRAALAEGAAEGRGQVAGQRGRRPGRGWPGAVGRGDPSGRQWAASGAGLAQAVGSGRAGQRGSGGAGSPGGWQG